MRGFSDKVSGDWLDMLSKRVTDFYLNLWVRGRTHPFAMTLCLVARAAILHPRQSRANKGIA